jgi:hypothetical protein
MKKLNNSELLSISGGKKSKSIKSNKHNCIQFRPGDKVCLTP